MVNRRVIMPIGRAGDGNWTKKEKHKGEDKRMNIKYGMLDLTGDFILRDIREMGPDRDFFIDPGTSVINFIVWGKRIQITGIKYIVIRASLITSEITIHALGDSDLFSSFMNIETDLSGESLEFIKEENSCCIVISKIHS